MDKHTQPAAQRRTACTKTRTQTRQRIQKAQRWLSRYRSSHTTMDHAMYLLSAQIQLADGLSYVEREHLLSVARCAHAEFIHAWSRLEHERLRWYAWKRKT